MKLRPAPQLCEFEGCKRKPVTRCSNCLRWICEKHRGDISGLCEECSKIPESKRERETVIVISAASPFAFIVTAEKPWIRKLSRLNNAELLRVFKDKEGRVYAYEFAVDKRQITLTSRPRKRYDKF